MNNFFIGKALIAGTRKTVLLKKSNPSENTYILGETPYFQKAADVVCSTSGDVIFGRVCSNIADTAGYFSNIADIAEFCRNNLSSEQIDEFGEALHTRALVNKGQGQSNIMRVPNLFYKKQPNTKR